MPRNVCTLIYHIECVMHGLIRFGCALRCMRSRHLNLLTMNCPSVQHVVPSSTHAVSSIDFGDRGCEKHRFTHRFERSPLIEGLGLPNRREHGVLLSYLSDRCTAGKPTMAKRLSELRPVFKVLQMRWSA